MKSWELENVVEASKKNQDSFFIPTKTRRENQKINSEVRLHFILNQPEKNEPRAERLWVKITKEKSFLSKYKGQLINSPLYIKELKIGDEIEFDSSNIAQIIMQKDDLEWIDSAEKMALVSKMCLDKEETNRFLYREKPDREEDSGWRLFTGHENDDYSNNPANIQIMNVGYLLNKDPSLLEPLKGECGSVFERVSIHSQRKKVTDWSPEL